MSLLVPDFSPFGLAEAQSDKDQMGLLTRNFFLSYACLACLPGSLTFLPQARHPESGEGQSEGGGEAG